MGSYMFRCLKACLALAVTISLCFSFLVIQSKYKDSLRVSYNYNFDNNNVSAKYDILKLLHEFNAFFIDIDSLRNISLNNNNIVEINDKNKDLIDYTFYYGVFDSYFKIDKLNLLLSHKCDFKETNGEFNKNNVLTNIYLFCIDIKIQLTIFYTSENYFWTGIANGLTQEDIELYKPKWFGDVERIFKKFQLKKLDSKPYAFYVPNPIEKFLFYYDHSKYVKCNSQMSLITSQYYAKAYPMNPAKNRRIIQIMNNITSKLESLNKHYWLAGGTLLGWYRDCGIIPYTTDIDLAMWSEEYDPSIRKLFMGADKKYYLDIIFGMKNDSYEIRLKTDFIQVDIFFAYPFNQTHQWCGYQSNRKKFRRWLPYFNEVCSTELFGFPFMVPCDPTYYLNKEYGKIENWRMPKKSNYKWTNLDRNYMNWTYSEWPHVIKFYYRNGSINKKDTLKFINQHLPLKLRLKEIPYDDHFD